MDSNSINDIKTALDALRDSQAAADAALKNFEGRNLPKEIAGLREVIERLNIQLKEKQAETDALRQSITLESYKSDDSGINAVKAALDVLRESQAAADAALKTFEARDLPKELVRLREVIEQLNIQLKEKQEETNALRQIIILEGYKMDDNGINAVRAALNALMESQAAADAALKTFEGQNLPKENARLHQVIEELNVRLQENRAETETLCLEHERLIKEVRAKAQAETDALRAENKKLTQNFKREMSSKRSTLIGLSQKQYQDYLTTGLEKERKRIAELYAELQRTMNHMSAELNALDEKERGPLTAELANLRERVKKQAAREWVRKESAWFDIANNQMSALNELNNAPIEDSAFQAVRKFFQWETFVGMKLISVIGALFILSGAYRLGSHLYDRMNPLQQCAIIFVLGLALMIAGEVFYRKKWRGGFTLALTASGSSVLFLGAALGHMNLGAIPSIGTALNVCAGVALLSLAASLRYNSQLVAVFALLGGYLPLRALLPEVADTYAVYCAGYFTILSLFALAIATKKNWRIVRYLGFFGGLTAEMVMLWNISQWDMKGSGAAVATAIGVSFIAYLIIPVFGAWSAKRRIIAEDIALLACNIVFRFILGLFWVECVNGTQKYLSTYYISHSAMTNPKAAYVAIFFAVCCLVMGLAVERQKKSGAPESETASLRALFLLTSFTFGNLVILFALSKSWLSAALLFQATGMLLYGISKNHRHFQKAGAVIGMVCLCTFLFFNVPLYKTHPMFVWKYLAITLAAFIVAIATLKLEEKRRDVRTGLHIFRCAAAFNVWVYIVYAFFNPLFEKLGAYNATLLSITLGFAFVLTLPRIRRIYNPGFHLTAIAAGLLSAVWLLLFNDSARGLASGSMNSVFALYVIANIIAVVWINDLLRFSVGMGKLSREWYPLLVSSYAVLTLAHNLFVQLSLKPSHSILTLLFGLTALGWIVFGFVKRNSITRLSGLILALFSVAKFVFLDRVGHRLGQQESIVPYFTAGAVMLAISFVYQWFSKRLEIGSDKAEQAASEPEKNN